MREIYRISSLKIHASKPENLRRLARFMGIDDSLSHDDLASLVDQEINQEKPRTQAQREEYENFWLNV